MRGSVRGEEREALTCPTHVSSEEKDQNTAKQVEGKGLNQNRTLEKQIKKRTGGRAREWFGGEIEGQKRTEMETGNMLRKSRRSERRKRKREGHVRHNSSLKPEKESSVLVCLHVAVCDSVCVQVCARIHKYFASPLDGLITTKPFFYIVYAALRTIISKVMTRSDLNELQQV